MKKLFLLIFFLVLCVYTLTVAQAETEFINVGPAQFVVHDYDERLFAAVNDFDCNFTGHYTIPSRVDSSFGPASVTQIASGVFNGCTGLTGITIPDSVTVIGWSFRGCTGLTSITIPDSVTYLGGAFEGCTGLMSVTISNSLQEIADNTFKGCTSLKSVNIPDSVTTIGVGAFEGCTGLTNITIPDSVTRIGHEAFRDCIGLTSVNIPGIVSSAIGNKEYDQRMGMGLNVFEGCTGLTSVDIAYGFDYIPESTFLGCTSLTSVNIPESVIEIQEYAFCGCYSLTSVNIPESVIAIQRCAFSACYSLESVNFPDRTICYIGDNAFAACTSLSSINLACGEVSDYAFWGCTSLTSVTFRHISVSDASTLHYTNGVPHPVLWIGDQAFFDCENLSDFTVLSRDMYIREMNDCFCSNVAENENERSLEPIPFTVYCYRGSNAQSWAQEKGRDYIFLDDVSLSATFALYNGLPEEHDSSVEQLYEDGLGNYSWETEAGEDSIAMTLALEVENIYSDSLIPFFDVTLSDGFSFSEDEIVSSKRLMMDNSKQTYYEPIYPVNVEKLTEQLVVTISDDFQEVQATQVFAIKQRDCGTVTFQGQSVSTTFNETLELDWNNELFIEYANSYSQKMAELCLYLSLSGRNKDMLKSSLNSWHFEDLDWNTEDYSGIQSCIASRKIVTKDDPINLVVIVVNQGNDYTWGDWIFQSIFGEQAYLKPSLYAADADRIVNRMFDYLVNHEMGFANTAILVCGKNNGGAVANVITHRIHTTYNFLKVKGYTFATPNVTSSEPETEANLYNYCYAHDAVTLVPKKFFKYGYTLYVGGKPGFPDNVANEYVKLTGRTYEKPGSRIITGLLLNIDEEKISLLGGIQNALANLFLQTQAASASYWANTAEHYLAWLRGNGRSGDMSLDQLRAEFIVEETSIKAIQGAYGVVTVANGAKSLVDPSKSGLKNTFDGLVEIYNGVRDVCTNYVPEFWNKAKRSVLSFFSCPVDVTLYDSDGQKVAVFQNHVMVKGADIALARSWQDENCDILATPLSEDYVMTIAGNGEGTMDVATGVFDDTGNLYNNDGFLDIPVHSGSIYYSGHLYNVTADGSWVSYVYAADDRMMYLNGNVYAEEQFVLPSQLSELSEQCFANNANLGGLVVVPKGVTSIKSNAFSGTGITVVVVEGSNTVIADDAFGSSRPIFVCEAGSQIAEWAGMNGFPCVKMHPN